MTNRIPISEIFWFTIQWEWRNTWKPSTFVRFWWCCKICHYCDTKYSWDITVDKPNMMSLEEIIEQIKSYKSKHIIFTWWEPSLFQSQMIEIQESLLNQWYTYEIETNWARKLDEHLEFSQINVSPKLESSWNKAYNLDIIDTKLNNCIYNMDFKFVCWNLKSLIETDRCIKKYNIKKENIYIMPEWVTVESQNNKIVLDYCIKNLYNYCLRSHIILFWDKKWF